MKRRDKAARGGGIKFKGGGTSKPLWKPYKLNALFKWSPKIKTDQRCIKHKCLFASVPLTGGPSSSAL